MPDELLDKKLKETVETIIETLDLLVDLTGHCKETVLGDCPGCGKRLSRYGLRCIGTEGHQGPHKLNLPCTKALVTWEVV